MDASLARLVELVAGELRLPAQEVLAFVDAGDSDVAEVSRELWGCLAARKPEAFWGSLVPLTAVGYAYRYARRRVPETLSALQLSSAERRMLRETRHQIADWCGHGPWPSVRHVVYEADCLPIEDTVALRGRYAGGFAFTWHRGMTRTAIYPAARVAEFRAHSAGTLVSVLLHEEFHLAMAATCETYLGTTFGLRVFEATAQLAQLVAALVCAGYNPTLSDLHSYLELLDWPKLIRLIEVLGVEDIPDLLRQSAAAARAAVAGDQALTTLLGSERVARARSTLAL